MTKTKNDQAQSKTSAERLSIGHVLRAAVSSIILGVIFLVVVTPIGFIMRIFGRDPMRRVVNPDQETCRVQSKRRNRNHVEKPY